MPRLAALLLLLTACGSRDTGNDPAWPRSAGHESPDKWEDDGGESLAPRRDEMSAIESSKEPTPPGETPVAEPMVETPLDTATPPDAAPAAAATDAGVPAATDAGVPAATDAVAPAKPR